MVTLENEFLTIVVPVYNVENYLAECLDSLVGQTVQRHKVIVVNDGTKDSSGEIAKAYAQKHPDLIQYVEQENQGLGAARNTGLKLVNTQFVTFLDSDDWQNRKFVEVLAHALGQAEDAPDLIYTLPWIYDNASKRVLRWYDKGILEDAFYPHGKDENVPSVVLNTRTNPWLYALEPNACRKVYRTEFLRQNDFFFPIGVKWEDIRPHFQLLHRAANCIAVRGTGFFYRINTGGQITAGGGVSRMDMIPVFRETVDMALQEHWDAIEIAFILRMLVSYTDWCIHVTNREYMLPFLKGMHELFKSIPYSYFKTYFSVCSPRARGDRRKVFVLRSRFYGILADYWTKGILVKLVKKIVRK